MDVQESLREFLYLHKVMESHSINNTVIESLLRFSYFKSVLTDSATTPLAVAERLIESRFSALDAMFTRIYDENWSLIQGSIYSLPLPNLLRMTLKADRLKEGLKKVLESNKQVSRETINIYMDSQLVKYGHVDHRVFLKEMSALLDFSDQVVQYFYRMDKDADVDAASEYLEKSLLENAITVDLCENPDKPCYHQVFFMGKYFYVGIDNNTGDVITKSLIPPKYHEDTYDLPEVSDMEDYILPNIEALLDKIREIIRDIKAIPRTLQRVDVRNTTESTRWLLCDKKKLRRILATIDFMNSNLSVRTVFLSEYMDYLKQTIELREVLARD